MPTRRRHWSDGLPPDVLREIAGRVDVAADFVSFHAVCKPWRDSRDNLSRTTTTTTNQFLPRLLTSAGKPYGPLRLRCVFSKSTYRRAPSPPRGFPTVASADGAALWYLTVHTTRPCLHDPLTGAVTDLPCFEFPYYFVGHWEKHNPCGMVYGDGTTLLYTVLANGSEIEFRAALLRPGDTRWTLVDRRIETLGGHWQGEFCAAYHRGRILVTAQTGLWRVITPGGCCDCDVLIPRLWMPGMIGCCSNLHNYVMESHGELLWVSVEVRWRYTCRYPLGDRHVRTISVVVHALEGASTSRNMLWARKDGPSLADRVLFLGSPNSFAVEDASLLGGGHGGCAYFVYHSNKASMRPLEQFGVFRYNLVNDKTQFIERLPREWDNQKCTWLVPRPTVDPIQEIIERKMEAQNLIKQQMETASVTSPSRVINIKRHYEPSFRVLVRNLPLNVKRSQLRHFFSKHGKVSNTEIIYHKNTKTSQGMGFVTIATMHFSLDDALAALDGLVLDGCSLEVILVNGRRRRQRRKEALLRIARLREISSFYDS